MRIAVVHDSYAPIAAGNIGGEDNLVQLEIDLLRARGHEVLPIVRSLDGLQRKSLQLSISATGRGISPLPLAIDFEAEVIHTNNLSLYSGYEWLSKSEIPIVSSFHNYRPFCSISIAWRNGLNCFECRDVGPTAGFKHRCGGLRGALNSTRRTSFQRDYPELKFPARLIFTSERMHNAYAPLLPSSSKVDIIPNPTRDVSNLSYSPLLNERQGFLFSGRLSPEKGILSLVNCWPDNEKLDIAGNGVELEAITSQIKDRRNINLIGTYPPNDFSIYNRYEALIFPSQWLEGSPLVVTEAISSGMPVIATEASSAEEIIQASRAGLIIKGTINQEKLVDVIRQLRMDWTSFHAAGIKAKHNELNPSRWIEQVLNSLNSAKTR